MLVSMPVVWLYLVSPLSLVLLLDCFLTFKEFLKSSWICYYVGVLLWPLTLVKMPWFLTIIISCFSVPSFLSTNCIHESIMMQLFTAITINNQCNDLDLEAIHVHTNMLQYTHVLPLWPEEDVATHTNFFKWRRPGPGPPRANSIKFETEVTSEDVLQITCRGKIVDDSEA